MREFSHRRRMCPLRGSANASGSASASKGLRNSRARAKDVARGESLQQLAASSGEEPLVAAAAVEESRPVVEKPGPRVVWTQWADPGALDRRQSASLKRKAPLVYATRPTMKRTPCPTGRDAPKIGGESRRKPASRPAFPDAQGPPPPQQQQQWYVHRTRPPHRGVHRYHDRHGSSEDKIKIAQTGGPRSTWAPAPSNRRERSCKGSRRG